MSRTKIIILQLREIIYAAILVGLGILLIILLCIMFLPGKGKSSQKGSASASVDGVYEAGVYTKEIHMGDSVVNLQVSLDKDNVKSVELVNLEKSVATLYPLMKPTVNKISTQLAEGKQMDEIVVSKEAQYTEQVIASGVQKIMEKHRKK